ncbi:hypothetical protein AOLI_G00234080 [Acnodon oligacanthus]
MKILLIVTLCQVSDAWGIEHLTAVLGETVTISCNYPKKFNSKPKCLAKRSDDSHTTVVSTTESPKGRFSISDDRRSNTVSVNITDVTQEDSGHYSCKVMKGNDYSTLRRIYLEIIDSPIIIVCFFIALMLLGVLSMMKYRQRQHKTNAVITRSVDSACSGQRTTGGNDENDAPRPKTKQSNSDHQSPNSNMSQLAGQTGCICISQSVEPTNMVRFTHTLSLNNELSARLSSRAMKPS